MTDPGAVEVPVPDSVRALNLLHRVDYEDAYCVEAADEKSPEQWMRAFLEDAPRWFQFPWAGLGIALLGARFGPLHGPDHVLGWKTLEARDDVYAVGLDSVGGLHARLFASTPPGTAIVATQIRLDTAYARRLWPAIRRGHRYFAPYLLRRAARSAQEVAGTAAT